MPDFEQQYRELFETFGYPLSRTQGVAKSVLDKAEKRLGVPIPTSLRAYYSVAGKEKNFNVANQRFLAPSKWFVHQRHLVFLEENQSVCYWGVSLKSKGAADPLVAQGAIEEKTPWEKVHSKCSKFISVILHYQAVSDGYKSHGWTFARDDAHEKLKSSGFKYVGEVNQLWAFHRANQVVCITADAGPLSRSAMLLMGGGKTAKDLSAIGQALGVKF